jgi:hypothetical protein
MHVGLRALVPRSKRCLSPEISKNFGPSAGAGQANRRGARREYAHAVHTSGLQLKTICIWLQAALA